MLLLNKIDKAAWDVECAHLDLRRQISILEDTLQSAMFEGAKRNAGEVAYSRSVAHKFKLRNKLFNLIDKTIWTKIGRESNITNLSSIVITKEQREVLGLGLSCCLGTSKTDVLEGISNVNHFNFKYAEFQLAFLKGCLLNNHLGKQHNILPK